MFGDPDNNHQNLPIHSLASIAEISSGITKGRKVKSSALIKVPYICTANVQNGYIDWAETKYIDVTEDEISKYSLSSDDVLMIEGGDPDKVGRGCIAGTLPAQCIYQNHVFCVRLNKQIILPEFFATYILLPSVKEYFLRCAKQTSGIATINKRQLSELKVICPTLTAQKDGIAFIQQADKSKLAIQQSLESLEKSRNAIMNQIFG